MVLSIFHCRSISLHDWVDALHLTLPLQQRPLPVPHHISARDIASQHGSVHMYDQQSCNSFFFFNQKTTVTYIVYLRKTLSVITAQFYLDSKVFISYEQEETILTQLVAISFFYSCCRQSQMAFHHTPFQYGCRANI